MNEKSYFANYRLEIWGTTTLGIFVSFALLWYVLIHLVICENSRLCLKNLHGECWVSSCNELWDWYEALNEGLDQIVESSIAERGRSDTSQSKDQYLDKLWISGGVPVDAGLERATILVRHWRVPFSLLFTLQLVPLRSGFCYLVWILDVVSYWAKLIREVECGVFLHVSLAKSWGRLWTHVRVHHFIPFFSFFRPMNSYHTSNQ